MILAKPITALSNEGKTYTLSAFKRIKDIRPAADRGYWFDVAIPTLGVTSWRRLWSEAVPVLKD